MDIQNFIIAEMENRGYARYKSMPIVVDITQPTTIINLNRYLYLFCSRSIDTKIHTKLELISPDNYFVCTKTTLEKSDVAQYQFFGEELEIKVSNYGKDLSSFVPFRLEFMKVIPEIIVK